MNADAVLAEAWRDRRCPSVNGIIHADGRIDLVDVTVEIGETPAPDGDYQFRYSVRQRGSTSLYEMDAGGKLTWTWIHDDRSATITDAARNIRAYCGCGTLEEDGFVAVANADDDQLIWLAFFDQSEPFVSLQVTRDSVDAVSEAGNIWSFPIQSPRDVVVH